MIQPPNLQRNYFSELELWAARSNHNRYLHYMHKRLHSQVCKCIWLLPSADPTTTMTTMDTDTLRVLVVADEPLARAGLTTLLSTHSECLVVGQISTGGDLPAEADAYRPDVILWDLGWDPRSVINEVDYLDFPLPVVVLLPDEAFAADVWAAGIRNLLFRDATADKLLAALQAAGHNLTTIESELVFTLHPDRPLPDGALTEELTPRELEVLQLVAEGLPNKTIALELDISEHTVKFHINAILGKFGAQSRTEAVVQAARSGLLLL